MGADEKFDVTFRALPTTLSGDPVMQVMVLGLPIGTVDWDPEARAWRADLDSERMRILGLVDIVPVRGETMLALRDALTRSLRRTA